LAWHADLRKQFLKVARKHSPEPRHVYTFLTTAIVRIIFLFPSFFLLPFQASRA
jgi:hypothetical protein